MDPPTTTVQTTVPTTTTTTTTATPISPHNSDDQQQQPPQPTTKLRLMCSYGGHIVPRPHTKSLCYINGDTRMIVIDRTTTLSDLLTRLSLTLPHPPLHKPFTLKYQLPNEDLDSLITVSTDEDLDNMIDEYDRLNSGLNPNCKPGRIRLFLFPVKPDGAQSMGNLIDGSDDWFLNALNGGGSGGGSDGGGRNPNLELNRGFSDPNSVDCLLGLDRGVVGNPNFGNYDGKGEKGSLGNLQDVQSVPESPIIETTSSFGSTASSPTMANLNLPQIRVHVEEGGARVSEQRVSGDGGIEEQFAQMGVGGGGGGGGQGVKRVDEGFVGMSSPPSGVVMVGGGGEFGNRVYVEDERLKQQQQIVGQGGVGGGMGLNSQQKPQLSAELPSPDSVSSDTSLSSATARQRPVIYQDPSGHLSSGGNRFPPGAQVQQVSESGYALHPQYDQYQQLMLHRHQHQQLLQQQHQAQTQQQAQTQTQPQTQQQYIPAGAHFLHHHPSGAVPMPAYYYPPQQPPSHPQPYPVYYVPAGQAQAQGYSLPGQQQPSMGGQQQPSMGEAPTSIPSNRTQTPPNPTLVTTSVYNPAQNINMQAANPEMGPGVYTTTTGPAVPQQQQYVAYSQIHHPPQPVVSNTAPASGYAYEFTDPARPQIYYTQPQTPVLASQYQGMTTGGTTMMMSDGSSQLPNDGVKQQTGSSQPL
ncbi:hypothetical protein KSS87_002488 [Heliosperma pusillum]|nr:hypothetical protein KSS87_002488 [Heliosperma pusillum]